MTKKTLEVYEKAIKNTKSNWYSMV
jgi:hypothetical protein